MLFPCQRAVSALLILAGSLLAAAPAWAQAWQTCWEPVTAPSVRSMMTIVAIAFWHAVQYSIAVARSLAVGRAGRTAGDERVELERAGAEVRLKRTKESDRLLFV